MRVNPSQLAAMARNVFFPKSPSLTSGYQNTDPRGSIVHAEYPQPYVVMRISLIPMDPNNNGGRDSNGLYRCYVQDADFNTLTGILVEARLQAYTNQPALGDNSVSICYPISNTSSSPNPADDGFIIYVPLSSVAPTLLLGKYVSSGGMPSYWQPGTTQTVHVWTGSPFTETDSTMTITGVANRFGPIAPGFVLIGFNGTNWYVVAPQGQALLCQYVGTDPWFYGDTNGASTLKVYGGKTVGSETDQSWFLNGVQNYHEDIMGTDNGGGGWVWVNTNGYRSDESTTDYTLNWYVVDDAVPKPYMNLKYPYTVSAAGQQTTGAIKWDNRTDVSGFTTTDGIHFAIPDNRKYLITITIPVSQGFTPNVTLSEMDAIDAGVELLISGSIVAATTVRVGYVTTFTYTLSGGPTLVPSIHYLDLGQTVAALTYIIEALEGSTISAALSLTAVNGSGSTVYFGDGGGVVGNMTVVPFDQG